MGGILTKGMGASACSHLIIGRFRLHLADMPVVPPAPSQSTGGGLSVREGSRAAQIIQHQLDRNNQHIEQDNPAPVVRKKQVNLAFSFNDKIYEKTFIVDVEQADKIVTAINWVNKTRDNISIVFDNLTKKTD